MHYVQLNMCVHTTLLHCYCASALHSKQQMQVRHTLCNRPRTHAVCFHQHCAVLRDRREQVRGDPASKRFETGDEDRHA